MCDEVYRLIVLIYSVLSDRGVRTLIVGVAMYMCHFCGIVCSLGLGI